MKTNVIERGKWERELEVEVPAERVEAEVDRAYKKYRRDLEVPGFRKGKVPLKLIQQRYGDAIRQHVVEDLLPDLLSEAARAAGLVPAAPPRITQLDHQPGQPLKFTAALDIWPEVEVAVCEHLRATRVKHTVTEEEIDQQVKELQNRHAAERAVERPLEKGDVLIADLQRLDESGLPIVGERYEERYFIIGSEDAPSPQFDEALIGIRADEERRVHFAYRDDLPNRELAGRQERFGVTAREVRERILPGLDDDFAREINPSCQSLAELRQHLARQLQLQWGYIASQRLRSELINELIKKNPFDLPDSLVETYLDSLHREHDREHGHDHDHEHEHSEEERAFAVRRLKSFLLIEGIRKKTGLAVAEEEFEEFLKRRAEENGIALEDLRRSPRLDDLRQELIEEKVFDFLVQRAEIEEQVV